MTALYHVLAAQFCRWRARHAQQSAAEWLALAKHHEDRT